MNIVNFSPPKTIIPIMKSKSPIQLNCRDARSYNSKPYCHPELVEGLTFSRLQGRADTTHKKMPILRHAQDDIDFSFLKF